MRTFLKGSWKDMKINGFCFEDVTVTWVTSLMHHIRFSKVVGSGECCGDKISSIEISCVFFYWTLLHIHFSIFLYHLIFLLVSTPWKIGFRWLILKSSFSDIFQSSHTSFLGKLKFCFLLSWITSIYLTSYSPLKISVA